MKQNTEDFEKRITAFLKESDNLAKKLRLRVAPMINFNNPERKAPLLGRIGVFLLQRSGGFLDSQFTNLKK